MSSKTFKIIGGTIAFAIIVLTTLRILHILPNNGILIFALVSLILVQTYYIAYLEKKQV
jgi:hypothetical protein